MLRILPAH